jgi:hypothetical protein
MRHNGSLSSYSDARTGGAEGQMKNDKSLYFAKDCPKNSICYHKFIQQIYEVDTIIHFTIEPQGTEF